MIFRDALLEDIPYIVALLADDPLGAQRERLGDSAYSEALKAIDADPTTRFIIAEEDGAVIGCMQVSILPGLARRGAKRVQFESLRVVGGERRKGIGAALVAEGLRLARQAGCTLAEITTDQTRDGAQRFWERQGFKATHVGFKHFLT